MVLAPYSLVIGAWSLVICFKLLRHSDKKFRQSVGGLQRILPQLPEVFRGAESLENGAGRGAKLGGETFLLEQMFNLGRKLVIQGVANNANAQEWHMGVSASRGDGVAFHVASD